MHAQRVLRHQSTAVAARELIVAGAEAHAVRQAIVGHGPPHVTGNAVARGFFQSRHQQLLIVHIWTDPGL